MHASQIAALPADQRRAVLAALTDAQAAELLGTWSFWARAEQLPPPGNWTGWLILAGRGFGKTRTGAEFVTDEVKAGRGTRVGLIAETSADGRDIIAEGESGLIAVGDRCRFRPAYEPSKRRLTWPNGAQATLYDGREPDQLRGPQHDLVWADELAKYRYAQAVYDQMLFGLRLGDHPRWIATTTPRPIPLLRQLMTDATVHVTRGRTVDNLANLAPTFRKTVIERYEGTRLGRQELDAEILGDAPGALWTRRGLDECRVAKAPPLARIVVAVDPAVTSGEGANEWGIVTAGVGDDGHGYVLDDLSGVYSPDQAVRRAIAAYRGFNAETMVVEVNQGGEMFASLLRTIASTQPVRLAEVRATQGKVVRAQPIAALYEQGRVHHVGTHATLEDQMVNFTPERDAKLPSPDRVDALVWAFTKLFPRVIERVPDHARTQRIADGRDYLDRW